MKKDNYVIERMSQQEVQVAIDWAAEEGWNPGIHDAYCFYQADPNGFFIGRLNDEPIVCGCAVVYDENNAFFGLYIVKKEYRHHHYGIQLTKEKLAYAGNRNIGLDGVLNMKDKYANIGFKEAYLNRRFVVIGGDYGKTDKAVVKLQDLDIDMISQYDRQMFPAKREAFLSAWIDKSAAAYAYYCNNTLQGYGVIRQCLSGYKLGPLFADSEKIAEELLKALLNRVPNEQVYFDTPEINVKAQALIKRFSMQDNNFACMRMYTKGLPDIKLENVYGITTYELG